MDKTKLNKTQVLIITTIVIVAAVAGVGYYFLRPKPELEPIKIGALIPLTGFGARHGEFERQAFIVAEEYINEEGHEERRPLGRPIEIVIGDYEGKPEPSVALAERLVTVDGVVFLTGFYSSACYLAVIESVVDKYNIGSMGVATWVAQVTAQHNPYVFRICPYSLAVVDIKMQFVESLDVKKLAFIGSSDLISREEREMEIKWAEDNGYEITNIIEHSPDQLDFFAELSAIKESDPDIIIGGGGEGAPGFNLIRQHAELEMKQIMIAGEHAAHFGSEWWDSLGDYGYNRQVELSEWHPGLEYTPMTTIFRDMFKERWGIEPVYISMSCFDSILLIVDAIDRANSDDSEAIVEAMRDANLECTRGTIKFAMDETPGSPLWQQWTPPFVIWQWQESDGKPNIEVVYPQEFATSTLEWPTDWEPS